MSYIAIAIAALASPFIAAWSYRKATLRLVFADEAWGSLEYHANQLLQDRTIPPGVGDFVEFVAGRVGDGMMTRTFLMNILVRRKNHGDSRLSDDLNALTSGQDQHFNRFMIDAILYDSLRTAVSGAVLRRILYWLVVTAKDENTAINDAQAFPIAKAASRAYRVPDCGFA